MYPKANDFHTQLYPCGGRFPMRRRSACAKSVAYFRALKHHPRPEEHSNEHIQKFQVPDATMTRRFCHLATPPATAAAGLRPFGEMSEFEAVCLAIAKIAFKCRHCCRFGSPFSSGIPQQVSEAQDNWVWERNLQLPETATEKSRMQGPWLPRLHSRHPTG